MFLEWDADGFRRQFSQGLVEMLQRDSLGAWILVLANSMQDPHLRAALRGPIEKTYARLKGMDAGGNEDDMAVFNRIREGAPHHLFSHWHSASRDAWRLVTNPMRQLRPMRLSRDPLKSLYRDFDPEGFNFSRPHLEPEIFREGEWQGSSWRVLYNKFPFAPWHLLVVPDVNAGLPQYLTGKDHRRVMELVGMLSKRLPGVVMAYNSLGAGASVNHLHFQFAVIEDTLPVEERRWRHHGGNEPYPLDCTLSNDPDTAWKAIDERQQSGRPFNLIYRGGCCYLLMRKSQAEVEDCELPQGVTWYESAGVFVFPDQSRIPSCFTTSLGKYRC
jgi:diadenosine tetraphosphate (Ap4A) HIT family hydrolase